MSRSEKNSVEEVVQTGYDKIILDEFQQYQQSRNFIDFMQAVKSASEYSRPLPQEMIDILDGIFDGILKSKGERAFEELSGLSGGKEQKKDYRELIHRTTLYQWMSSMWILLTNYKKLTIEEAAHLVWARDHESNRHVPDTLTLKKYYCRGKWQGRLDDETSPLVKKVLLSNHSKFIGSFPEESVARIIGAMRPDAGEDRVVHD